MTWQQPEFTKVVGNVPWKIINKIYKVFVYAFSQKIVVKSRKLSTPLFNICRTCPKNVTDSAIGIRHPKATNRASFNNWLLFQKHPRWPSTFHACKPTSPSGFTRKISFKAKDLNQLLNPRKNLSSFQLWKTSSSLQITRGKNYKFLKKIKFKERIFDLLLFWMNP